MRPRAGYLIDYTRPRELEMRGEFSYFLLCSRCIPITIVLMNTMNTIVNTFHFKVNTFQAGIYPLLDNCLKCKSCCMKESECFTME